MNNYKTRFIKILVRTLFIGITANGFSQTKNNLKNKTMKKATLTVIDENKSDNAQTAISVSRSILEGNWNKLDSLLDDGFTYTGDGYVFTKDQYIGFMQEMRAAFSNFEMILEKTISEDDMVSIRFSSKVINTGKFMGAPANNKDLIVS